MNENNAIQIYQSADGEIRLDMKMENDTVWLSVNQMARLFDREDSNIRRHVLNVFKDGELERESNVHFLHVPFSDKPVPFYSLDVIISVGYRVKSQRGVQFRQWANKILKDYLIKGYAINKQLKLERYEELKDVVRLMARTMESQQLLPSDEEGGIFEMVKDYVYALDTLDRYDYQQLTVENTTTNELFHATYENAMEVVCSLYEKFGGSQFFGKEKDKSFHSSMGQIYQSFGGVDLYPSIEEKAAMLPYLVVKNYSFYDDNKRIAATLFLWFMELNGILYRQDGSKRIADNTLVALTLLIAESRTEVKDVMVKVVVNLINKNNM